MKSLIAIALAATYGLIIRLLFGFASDLLAIMGMTFLLLVPAVIGFLTVMLIPAEKTTSATAAFFKPWLTSLVLLAITLACNIEGAICWIMIFPIFAACAGTGGVIAFRMRKARAEGADSSDAGSWQNPNRFNVSLVFAIPLVLGFVEGEKALVPKQIVISREVTINAPSGQVWKELTSSQTIGQPGRPTSLSTLLGFPKHVNTTLDTLAVGGKRTAYYEKGLYFQETITRFRPQQLLTLRVNANPNAIPSAVMDEHILIGGKHLDILEDVYKLKPLPDGRTQLTLSSRFYINTPFNWYAGIWAHYLMSDILQDELRLIKNRATVKS